MNEQTREQAVVRTIFVEFTSAKRTDKMFEELLWVIDQQWRAPFVYFPIIAQVKKNGNPRCLELGLTISQGNEVLISRLGEWLKAVRITDDFREIYRKAPLP